MVGTRLRQARILAGLTQEQVVARLGEMGITLTKAGLSKYERGGSTPKPSLLIRLGKTLGVRGEFFLAEPSAQIEWLAFRKLARMPKRRETQIRTMAHEQVEGEIWLRELLYPADAPNIPREIEVRTHEQAEETAKLIRQRWGLHESPIESVTQAFEDQGGVILECEDVAGEFHGLSGWANARYPVAVVSSSAPPDRRRFNLAHEIGHLVMICPGVDERQQESFAHRFAAAFIVPPAVARRELGSRRRAVGFEELVALKQKHGLSVQAWIRRAFDLEIINQGTLLRMQREIGRRNWRRNEPGEYPGHECPTKLKQMTMRALSEGLIPETRARELCPGVFEDISSSKPREETALKTTARLLMRLPKDQRDCILRQAAAALKDAYREDEDLRGFEALNDTEDWES